MRAAPTAHCTAQRCRAVRIVGPLAGSRCHGEAQLQRLNNRPTKQSGGSGRADRAGPAPGRHPPDTGSAPARSRAGQAPPNTTGATAGHSPQWLITCLNICIGDSVLTEKPTHYPELSLVDVEVPEETNRALTDSPHKFRIGA